MKSWIFAQSRWNIPIPAWTFGSQGTHLLILGGVHGDEPEGIAAAHALLAHCLHDFSYKVQLTIVPMFNPDGALVHDRKNGAGIDLNRNLPTKDWSREARTPRYYPGETPNSEPENQALVRWIDAEKPKLILSLHSYDPMININGDCRAEAEIIAKHTGYKITEDMGYPTPGSLGTYGGKEGRVPVITYEIQRDLPLNEVIRLHLRPLCEVIKHCEAHR